MRAGRCHIAIVVTSGCIYKATKYTSHVEKEGEAWSQGIARTDARR